MSLEVGKMCGKRASKIGRKYFPKVGKTGKQRKSPFPTLGKPKNGRKLAFPHEGKQKISGNRLSRTRESQKMLKIIRRS